MYPYTGKKLELINSRRLPIFSYIATVSTESVPTYLLRIAITTNKILPKRMQNNFLLALLPDTVLLQNPTRQINPNSARYMLILNSSFFNHILNLLNPFFPKNEHIAAIRFFILAFESSNIIILYDLIKLQSFVLI